MNIDLKALSDLEIAQLLKAAAAELAARLAPAPAEQASATAAPAPPEPGARDKDFALMIARKLRKGQYILAAERERVAEIAQQFPAWVELQEMPTTSSAGEWKRQGEFLSVAREAERR